ncbi:MAG TPA: hypothetical protein V6D47_13075 [Oscillatoriaceae cyanobacterium]
MASLDIVDWVAPDALVISLIGELDAIACRQVAQRIVHLLGRWPDLRLTLDLSSVAHVAPEAAEALFLDLVARRATGAVLTFACPSAACQHVLGGLNIPYVPILPAGAGMLSGVTV